METVCACANPEWVCWAADVVAAAIPGMMDMYAAHAAAIWLIAGVSVGSVVSPLFYCAVLGLLFGDSAVCRWLLVYAATVGAVPCVAATAYLSWLCVLYDGLPADQLGDYSTGFYIIFGVGALVTLIGTIVAFFAFLFQALAYLLELLSAIITAIRGRGLGDVPASPPPADTATPVIPALGAATQSVPAPDAPMCAPAEEAAK